MFTKGPKRQTLGMIYIYISTGAISMRETRAELH